MDREAEHKTARRHARAVVGVALYIPLPSPGRAPVDWSSVTTRIETDGSLRFAPAQAIFPDGFDVYTIGEALGERAGSGEREGGAWVGGDGHPGWSAQ